MSTYVDFILLELRMNISIDQITKENMQDYLQQIGEYIQKNGTDNLDEKAKTAWARVEENKQSLGIFLNQLQEGDVIVKKPAGKYFKEVLGYTTELLALLDNQNDGTETISTSEDTTEKAEIDLKNLNIAMIQKLQSQWDLIMKFANNSKLQGLLSDGADMMLDELMDKRAGYSVLFENFGNNPGMFSMFLEAQDYAKHIKRCGMVAEEIAKIPEEKIEEILNPTPDVQQQKVLDEIKIPVPVVEEKRVVVEEKNEVEPEVPQYKVSDLLQVQTYIQKHMDDIDVMLKMTGEEQRILNDVKNKKREFDRFIVHYNESDTISADWVDNLYGGFLSDCLLLKKAFERVEQALAQAEAERLEKIAQEEKAEADRIANMSEAEKAIIAAKAELKHQQQVIEEKNDAEMELKDRDLHVENIEEFILKLTTVSDVSAGVLGVVLDDFENYTTSITKLGAKPAEILSIIKEINALQGLRVSIEEEEVSGSVYNTNKQIRQQLAKLISMLREVTQIDQTTEKFKLSILTLINEG